MRKPVSRTPAWVGPAAVAAVVALVVATFLVIRWYTTPLPPTPLAVGHHRSRSFRRSRACRQSELDSIGPGHRQQPDQTRDRHAADRARRASPRSSTSAASSALTARPSDGRSSSRCRASGPSRGSRPRARLRPTSIRTRRRSPSAARRTRASTSTSAASRRATATTTRCSRRPRREQAAGQQVRLAGHDPVRRLRQPLRIHGRDVPARRPGRHELAAVADRLQDAELGAGEGDRRVGEPASPRRSAR